MEPVPVELPMNGVLTEVTEAVDGEPQKWIGYMIKAGMAKNRASNGLQREYTEDALKAAVEEGLFDNVPGYFRTDTEHGKESDADVAGTWGKAVWDAAAKAVKNTFVWVKDKYPKIIDAKVKVALAEGKSDEIPGFSITGDILVDRKRPNVVAKISEIRSCDPVSFPSAGGKVIAVTESHKSQETHMKVIDALKAKGLEFKVQPGEGAFYGPKIEFTLHDSIGRAWQCGTIQVDFSMPGRLGAHYIAEDNSKQVPVMIHRAILGSVERFIGILIEHYAGQLPVWLSPTQAIVMNITDRQADYVKEVAKTLREKGFRADTDLRNEKIGFKIREHTLLKAPYLLVIGDREVEMQTVAVRTREGVDLGSMPVTQFKELLAQAVSRRGRQDLE
jgi:hypothetical protein